MKTPRAGAPPWYAGVTRYQWLVLVIASLGWIFDVFEGQIFVASMPEAMPSLLPASVRSLDDAWRRGYVAFYNNVALACFLAGGALGGVLFGWMSDRIGRTRTMIFTIATYSIFTFVSALSQAWWHLAVCRFLVAMGVGGEWAVASALVAEVFPARARAWSLAIFHASSVMGTCLAVAAGVFVIADRGLRIVLPVLGTSWELSGWRLGFVLGVVPALLIIWVRLSLREPESWQKVRAAMRQTGQAQSGGLHELLHLPFLSRVMVGTGLAAIGLATFWGVHIYGKDLLRQCQEKACLAEVLAGHADGRLPKSLRDLLATVRRQSAGNQAEGVARLLPRISGDDKTLLLKPHAQSIKRWEMMGMLLVTLGGGLGLVCFGPLCEWLGRRGAFLLFLLGGLSMSLVLFQFLSGTAAAFLFVLLPLFGFLTLGMHAGFAVYFPELFPTRLRGTGSGFCFNVGRVLAAPILFLSGWMQKDWHWSLEHAASILSLLFLLGPVLLLAAPETRGSELG